MPWYRVNGLTMHVKGTKLPSPCAAWVGLQAGDDVPLQTCAAFSSFLCDWPIGAGRTCDAALCAAHAQQVGRNKHYCPTHHQEHLASAPQRGLFTELVQP